MKTISALCFYVVFSLTAQAQNVPTPNMAVSFAMGKDSRKWVQQYLVKTNDLILSEFVPQGDDIEAWKEMVAQEIQFTKAPLPQFVDIWKGLLLKADPQVEITETNIDGSVLITYKSLFADELSLRRFIKGSDAIYMLAYHVRPKLKRADIFKMWSEIIQAATLIPNPEKQKIKSPKLELIQKFDPSENKTNR